MDDTSPRNVSLRIVIQTSLLSLSSSSSLLNLRGIHVSVHGQETKAGQRIDKRLITVTGRGHGRSDPVDKVIASIGCRAIDLLLIPWFAAVGKLANISMLKRTYSMEFESDGQFKSPPDSGQSGKDPDESSGGPTAKKLCPSHDEGKAQAEESGGQDGVRPTPTSHTPTGYRRFSQTDENAHVTQSRSIFSHKDSFVYGNPKEDIKSIEGPMSSAGSGSGAGDGTRDSDRASSSTSSSAASFETTPTNALDLSCKAGKPDGEDGKSQDEGTTYHGYQPKSGSGGYGTPESRPNVEIKLVGPMMKKPTIPEQLQIAKIQQQQRRSMQQQQKFLQQMRRSLDPKSGTGGNRSGPTTDPLPTVNSHKNGSKHFGQSNHDPTAANEMDNQSRLKEDFLSRIPAGHFPHLPFADFADPNHPKELPDNHPILPLLDPVYFSALYNAHGFLPPSSPSIAAAFIGTLQDALPKLPMMFPSTSANNSSLLPQKSNENPN